MIVNFYSGFSGGDQLILESGFESLQGVRKTMEDTHVAIDDLLPTFPNLSALQSPCAFYAVYDGKSLLTCICWPKFLLFSFVV